MSNATRLVGEATSYRRVLDFVLAHANGDERPYVNISIFGKNILGLLDSGSSNTLVGGKGWDLLKSIGLISLEKCSVKVTVANGEKCDCLGILRVPVKLRDRERLIDILVVPNLPHTLILGIDFWCRMGIVPDLRSGEWQFSNSGNANLACMEVLKSRSSLTYEEMSILDKLVDDTFSKMGTSIGCTTLVAHRIITDVEPIKQRYYPVSPAMMKHIDAELRDMLEKGIVEPSTSPWSSPIVMVPKKDGSWRFCVDYRKLNSVTTRDAYPLPYVSNILDKLRDARYLSSLDIKSAYFQVPLEESSKEKTAFTVPSRGLYQFKRLPFGLHNAPATWQRLIDRVLGMDLEPYLFVYLDDVIIVTQNFEKHIEVLTEVFSRLSSAGLTLNREKCQFCRTELRYLGYVVDQNGLHVDPEKINAILRIPTPGKVTEVRSIVGTASWYRRFIPNFSSIVAPLTELTKKNVKFHWSDRQEEAFRSIKEHLVSAPVLSCPDFSLPFIVQTDASGFGLGAILSQKHPEGEKVICYLSRSLTKCERQYSTTERECLAVVWAIEKLRPYIEGSHFTVVTDHWSLKWLANLKEPNGRLARWSVKLQQYDFDVIHRKGAEHNGPDMLSRSVPMVDFLQLCNIACDDKHPKEDSVENLVIDNWYRDMISKVNQNPIKFPSWRVVGSTLYKHNKLGTFPSLSVENDYWKRVIPKSERSRILQKCHDDPSAGHCGILKTFYRVGQKFYWPKLKSDIARYVRKCSICGRCKPEQRKPAGLMQPHQVASKPFEIITCDLIGPLPRSTRGFKFILVIVDSFSKLTLAIPLRNSTAPMVCKAIEDQWLLMFGQPRRFICDNGVQFRSKEFRNLMASYGVQISFTANYHAQANPTERANKTLGTMIRCYITNGHRDWDRHLSKLACAMRTQVHESTKHSPYFIVFGYDMPDNFELRDNDFESMGTPVNSNKNVFKDRVEAFKKLHAEVRKNLEKSALRNKRIYDLRRRDVSYNVGDKVLRRNFVLSDASKFISAKLANKYVGPFVIKKRVSPWTYELCDLDGISRGIWHAKDLKPFVDNN